jgi:hypothetical protein
MLTSAQLQPEITKLLQALVGLVGQQEATGDAAALLARFKKLKAELGNSHVAQLLGLNPNELEEFSKALRDLERPVSEGDGGERNRLIVQLRFISWMEALCDANPALSFSAEVGALISEDLGRKQVRALELILRSLVSARFGDQQALEQALAELLGRAVVDKWKSGADAGDLLSGTTFSELASLLINTREYPNYSPLFEDTPFLSYLRDKRKTIQSFLEDIRRIRNILAHNKRVTNTQLNLLDLYYEELISPVQEAHDQGQTKVNPDSYLDVSQQELAAYFDHLRTDIASVKDDIAEFRASVETSLGVIASDTAEIRQATGTISKRQQMIGLGVAVAVIGIAVVLYFASGSKQDTTEIRATTSRVEQKTEQSVRATQEATKVMVDTSQKITASLDTIREGFASLSKQGGLIDRPERPEQFYHNARLYELRGDSLNARRSYESLLVFDLDTIDPLLRYQGILKAQEGAAGAVRAFNARKPAKPSPAFDAAASLLLDDNERLAALRRIAEANPEYAPVFYLLSQQFSQKQLGQQSLGNKRDEKQALERFLQLARDGQFLKHFIDKELASAWLDDAEARLKPLAIIDQEPTKPPFVYTATRSGSGWGLYFNIPEAVRQFLYQLDGEPGYTDNGLGDYLDPRLNAPAAKTHIQLPPTQGETTLRIQYQDINRQMVGPFEIRFSPLGELVKSQKQILEMTKNNWLEFRRDPAYPLLYFTHLQSYRCAIAEVRYGLDQEIPATRWDGLGRDCNLDDPVRLADNLPLYLKVAPQVRFVSVQLSYRDGSQSAIVKIQRLK